MPIDPREVGAVFTSMGLADLLRSRELVDARLIGRRDSMTVAQVVVKTGVDRNEYEFDSSVGFLPTRKCTTILSDGSLKSCLEVSYQEVLDGRARFLKEAVEKFFPPGVAESPADTGWRQRIRQTVTELRINQEVQESVFDIHVPVGTVVSDRITKKVHVHGMESPESETSSRHLILIWCAGVGVLLIVAFAVYHAYGRLR